MNVIHLLDNFAKYLLAPISFLIILLVQLKIIATLRSQLSMIMFYGKQIEEIRKMMAGGTAAPRRLPEVPADETGLYEVLRE